MPASAPVPGSNPAAAPVPSHIEGPASASAGRPAAIPDLPPAPGWVAPVIVVTAAQAVLAMMTRALPLFGLPLTLAAGMAPEAAGQMAAATSLGSMLFFLWGPALAAGIPSLHQMRLGIGLGAAALCLCLLPNWPLILLAAFLIGLGYGPSAPAGSDILMRLVPPARRHFVFSFKQAGVPLGGLAAGLLLPAIGLAWGTGAALLATAAIGGLAALALGHGNVGLDDHPGGAPPPRPRGAEMLLAPLRMAAMLLRSRDLRVLSLAGIGLAVAQGVLLAFYPVLLSDGAGWSLTAAGGAFALLQGVGIGGRILMGWLTDRAGSGRLMLAGMCLASGLTMLAIAATGPGTPAVLVMLLAGLAGITVISWNGIFLTELAIASPEGQVGAVTAAGTFILFSGYVVSPLLAQLTVTLSGGYGAAYAFGGIAPALGALALLAARRR